LELLRVFNKRVLFADILPVTGSPLHVVDVVAVRVQNYLRGVVEKDAGSFVREIVAKPVLCGVVDPLFHPYFGFPWLYHFPLVTTSLCISLVVPIGGTAHVLLVAHDATGTPKRLSSRKA